MRLVNTLVLALLCATPLAAQDNQRYRFDNFDAHNGVRIAAVQTTDSLPRKSSASGKLANAKASDAKIKSVTANALNSKLKPVVYVPPRAVAGSNPLVGFTTGNPKVDSYIVDSGKRHGVDPALLYAIMHQESSFKARAVSYKGAAGLMQMMPGTAARFGIRDRFDPQQSVEGGARYMRFLLNYFGGDVSLALAGYNAGEGAVLRYGRRVPPYRETQDYVRRITRRYALMRDPAALRSVPRATLPEVAKIEPKVAVATTPSAPPPPSYAPEVFAVRLPDGKLRLVSQ